MQSYLSNWTYHIKINEREGTNNSKAQWLLKEVENGLFSSVTKNKVLGGWCLNLRYRPKTTLAQFSIAEDTEHERRRHEQERTNS